MSFWGRKKPRFSLQRLKELFQTLVRNPLVTERNKPLIIETLRELSEVIVYGDQHHPEYFDFFLEKNILGQLMRIMALKDTTLHIQILQTMSILIENISTKSSVYYLLSNDRVNDIIQHPFDFSDEELMAYYISFLKTLSLKLDESTVQFFFNHETQRFPLYTESVKFFNHAEGMVRVGVRTISLAVFKLREERVRAFVVSRESAPYFSNLVWFLQRKSEELTGEVGRLEGGEGGGRAMHGFRDCVDELSDLLYYLADIYALGVPELAAAMTRNLEAPLLQGFVGALSEAPPGSPAQRVALYVGLIVCVLCVCVRCV
jgi:protein CLEC16A